MDRFKYFFAILFSIVAVFFVSAAAVNAGPPLPDLKIESLTVDPASYSVKVMISNIGDAPLQLPGANSSVYLVCFNSAGIGFECSDRIKFFRALPDVPDFLEPGARLEVIFSPRSDDVAKVSAGMLIKDQYNNTIREKSTANNFISSTPIPRKPDLVFESISLTNQDFAYVVKNNGGGERAQAGVELQWLRQDKTAIGSAFYETIETPAAGSNARFSYRNDGYGSDVSKFIWHNTPRDASFLRVTLNYNNTVLESNMGNNIAEANRLFPDIKLDSLTFDPDTGKPKATISNIGEGTAVFTGTEDPCADLYIGGRDSNDRLAQHAIKCLAGAVWAKGSLSPGENMNFLVDFIPEPTIKNIFGVLNYSNLINEGEANKYQNNLISDVPVVWPDLAPVSAALDPVGRYPIITFKNQGSVKASSGGRGNTINFVWLNAAGQTSDGYSQTLLPGLDVSAGQTYTIDFKSFAQNYARYVLPKFDSVKIRVKVDSINRVYEGEDGENNNSHDFDLPLPDYIIDPVSFTDKLEYTIRNIGDSSPVPVAVRFQWLKQDGTSTGEPTISRDVVMPSANEQKVTYINDGGPIGKFFWTEAPQDARRLKLTITFTDREAPSESNTQNNSAEVERPLPDLIIVEPVTFDADGYPNVIVKNVGSATFKSSQAPQNLPVVVLGSWLKDDDSEAGTSFSRLRATLLEDIGKDQTVIVDMESSGAIPADAVKVAFLIDSSGRVTESDFNNNRKTVDRPLPDYTIVDASIAEDELKYTIRNISTSDTSQSFSAIRAQWLKEDKTNIGPSYSMSPWFSTDEAGVTTFRRLSDDSEAARFFWTNVPGAARYLKLTATPSYLGGGLIPEITTANNSFEIERKLPDFIFDESFAIFNSEKLEYVIKNIGDPSDNAGISVNARWIKQGGDSVGNGLQLSGFNLSGTDIGKITYARNEISADEVGFFWTAVPYYAKYLKLSLSYNPDADGATSLAEKNINNNIILLDRPVELKPDLRLDSLVFDQQSGKPKVSITNIGQGRANFTGATAPNCIDFYIRGFDVQRDEKQNAAMCLSSVQNGLDSGASMTFEADFSPNPGIVSISGFVNIYGLLDEGGSAEAQNDYILNVPVPLPDLVVDSVTFDPTLRYPIIIIKNQGNAPANKQNVNTPDAHYLWLNAAGEQIGDYLGFWNLDEIIELASGQSLLVGPGEGYESLSTDYLPPSGAVKVRVALDEMRLIAESNEDNNITEANVPEADADELDYPIAELGNCQTKEDCRVYCEQPENAEACAEFGVKYGLLTEEEAKALKDMSKIVKGPGDCKNKEECAVVCEQPENTDACLDFAEQNNWMSADDLSKARKVADILKTGGATPGSCSTPGSCKTYCSDNSNAVECVEFGKTAGLLTAEEAAEAEKVAPLMQSGAMPGGKTSREEIEAYCENNREECDKFFEQVGVKKEGEESEGEGHDDGPEEGPKDGEPKDGEPKDETKIPSIFNKDGAEDGGASPGGCKTKAECDAYCDSHPGECDEQVKQAGGEVKEATAVCSTREECESFCDDPANKEAESCKDGTIIIEEDPPGSLGPTEGPGEDPLEKLRSDIQEVISQSQSQDCVKQILGEEVFTKFVIEGGIPEKPISREELQPCFDEAKQAVEQQEMIKMQKKPDDPDMGSPPQ